MREIKFRAWDKDYKYMKHKVMVGNVWDEDNYHAHMIWVDVEDVDYECESGWMNFDEHSNIELMQYTGLKDKNGVEIYEGDILYFEPYETHGNDRVVEYIDGAYRGRLIRNGYSELLAECVYETKVIGNVYENPELLEREAE